MGYTPKQLGHLVIKVRDIERSVDFYTNVLGLTVMTGRPGGMTFLSANTTMSHELALVPLGMDAPGPEDRRVGMAHMAWQMNSFPRPEGTVPAVQGPRRPLQEAGRPRHLHGRVHLRSRRQRDRDLLRVSRVGMGQQGRVPVRGQLPLAARPYRGAGGGGRRRLTHVRDTR